jgi:arabinofuranan 3-O-arabinosyltransferase
VRRRSIPIGLTLASFALAFAQRPGTVVADTKVNLYVDPGRFLHDIASAWTPTASLGHVFAGQYGGYLFPMAPFFALGDQLGLPAWVVHRLWLGMLFALAAYGVIRLLDALLPDRPRGVAHVAAAVLFVVNPYVAVYVDRTSVSLLAYAALPWMLLAVHRGLREPRGWWWPALFALVLTSTGGGVNAAVTGWVLVGPLLFAVYERVWGGVGRGMVVPFVWRMAATNALASAWWVVPLLVHSKYGLNFLPFTEQPGTIWSTTSITESLRLMGFWTSYMGVGFGGHLEPFAGHGHVLLFALPVVVASLLVPALALAGFRWTRRWRYGPWFLLLTLVGLGIMAAGWPDGTPLRRGLTFTYNHVQALQFLRTTYKAGPLVALGLACLGGAAFAEAWARLAARPSWFPRAAVTAGLAALVALAAWPLASGRAPERQLALPHGVPAAWTAEGKLLDRRGSDSRAMTVPGQLFSFYRWGGTIDHVLPAVTGHPVATRYLVPFADLRSVDLQWAVDGLVSQETALPGQLEPLLSLIGVGDVVVNADGDRARSGELGAAEALDVLRGQGLRRPAAAFGPVTSVPRAAGRIAGSARMPQVQDFRTPTAGLVRVLPRGPMTIVDGGAQGLVDLAGFAALPSRTPIAYAGDLSPAQVRAAAKAGASFVVSDSNRRQAFVSSRLRGGRGAVLAAGQGISADGTMLDPFAARGPDAQTVQVLAGVRTLTSPFSPQVTQFPEHRPYAAMDGDLSTAWLADRFLTPERHHLDVTFSGPRDVPYLRLYPYMDSRGKVRQVVVNGQLHSVHRGWNTLRLGLRGVRTLSIGMWDVPRPKKASAGAGGIRELRIPGVTVSERLRPPVLVSNALRGAALERSSLTYVFDRFAAAAPRRVEKLHGEQQAGLLRDQGDPERSLARTFTTPAARAFTPDAWLSVDPRAGDDALDLLAGYRGRVPATSSSRFQGRPADRASRALDGDPATAWVGQWIPGQPVWLGWRTPRPQAVRCLTLVPMRARVRRPASVRLTVDGHTSGPLAVGADGGVCLPAPARGRAVRIDVLAARFPAGTPKRERQRRAVAVAEVRGAPRVVTPRRGRLQRCVPVISLDGAPVAVRLDATVRDLDMGRPLRARPCGSPRFLPAGRHDLVGIPGTLRADHLRLVSPAPATAPKGGGTVLEPGSQGNGRRDGVRVKVAGPSWLVLGESYDAGWRATCDGRSLGAPTPLQGYANAWKVARGCTNVSFGFAPNRLLPPAYLLSLAGCLALLALLVVRRRRPDHPPGLGPFPEADPPARWPLTHALAAAVVAILALGFVFALRAGIVLGPLVGLALWRGVGVRHLVAGASALLLVVVPVLYVLSPGEDHGGYNTYFAVQHLGAHWMGVGAVVMLALALARTLSTATARGAARRRSAP